MVPTLKLKHDIVLPSDINPYFMNSMNLNENLVDVNPKTKTMYMAVFNDTSKTSSVLVWDAKRDTTIQGIPSMLITDLSTNPWTNMTYATMQNTSGNEKTLSFQNIIYMIDDTKNRFKEKVNLDSIKISLEPYYVATNPKTNMIYVSGYNFTNDRGEVIIINGENNKVINEIPVGKKIPYISVNPNKNLIYVAAMNETSSYLEAGLLTVIDGSTSRIKESHKLEITPQFITVNPRTNMIYVGGTDGSVTQIDGTNYQPVTTLPLNGDQLSGITVNPLTNKVYAIDSDSMSVIDGVNNTMDADVTIPQNSGGIGVDPVINKIYISDFDSNSISIVNGIGNIKEDIFQDQSHLVKNYLNKNLLMYLLILKIIWCNISGPNLSQQ